MYSIDFTLPGKPVFDKHYIFVETSFARKFVNYNSTVQGTCFRVESNENRLLRGVSPDK